MIKRGEKRMRKIVFIVIGGIIILFVVFMFILSPKHNYRFADLITQGIRLSDGSIALLVAKTYGDHWGESFVEIIVFNQQNQLLSRHSVPNTVFRDTDVVFEAGNRRDFVQVRFLNKNEGVKWDVNTKQFDTENVKTNDLVITLLELRGVSWN